MEEFRKTLDTGVYTKRPVQDGGFGFDPVAPVAKLFSAGASVYETGQKRKAARAAAERELETENAENAANQLIFELKTSPEFQQIEQFGRASEAGAMDPAAYRTRSEVALRKLMKRYPRDHATIMKVIRETGYDSEVFAEFDARQKVRDTNLDNVMAANTAAFEAAVNMGMDPNTVSREEMLARGREALDAEFEWQQKTSRAAELRAEEEAIRAENRETRAQQTHSYTIRKSEIEANNRDLLFSLQRRAALNIPQVITEINALTQRAAETGSTEDMEALQDRLNEATRALGDMRQWGISEINSEEGLSLDMGVVTGWNAWIDTHLALIEAAQSGPLGARAVTTARMDDVARANLLKARELAPMLMGFRDIFGGLGSANMITEGIIQSDLILLRDGATVQPGELTVEVSKVLDHLNTLKKVPSADTLPEGPAGEAILNDVVRPTADKLRSKIAEGQDISLDEVEAFSTFSQTLLSTVPSLEGDVFGSPQEFTSGKALTDNQAYSFTRTNFSSENLAAIKTMRSQFPVQAVKLEREMARKADAVFKDQTTEFGQWSIPLQGELPEGRGAIALGSPVIESGVFWDTETDTFVGYGSLTDRRKAESLNSSLRYLIDYNKTYNVMGEVDTLELYVHRRLPQDALSKAMGSNLSGDN